MSFQRAAVGGNAAVTGRLNGLMRADAKTIVAADGIFTRYQGSAYDGTWK